MGKNKFNLFYKFMVFMSEIPGTVVQSPESVSPNATGFKAKLVGLGLKVSGIREKKHKVGDNVDYFAGVKTGEVSKMLMFRGNTVSIKVGKSWFQHSKQFLLRVFKYAKESGVFTLDKNKLPLGPFELQNAKTTLSTKVETFKTNFDETIAKKHRLSSKTDDSIPYLGIRSRASEIHRINEFIGQKKKGLDDYMKKEIPKCKTTEDFQKLLKHVKKVLDDAKKEIKKFQENFYIVMRALIGSAEKIKERVVKYCEGLPTKAKERADFDKQFKWTKAAADVYLRRWVANNLKAIKGLNGGQINTLVGGVKSDEGSFKQSTSLGKSLIPIYGRTLGIVQAWVNAKEKKAYRKVWSKKEWSGKTKIAGADVYDFPDVGKFAKGNEALVKSPLEKDKISEARGKTKAKVERSKETKFVKDRVSFLANIDAIKGIVTLAATISGKKYVLKFKINEISKGQVEMACGKATFSRNTLLASFVRNKLFQKNNIFIQNFAIQGIDEKALQGMCKIDKLGAKDKAWGGASIEGSKAENIRLAKQRARRRASAAGQKRLKEDRVNGNIYGPKGKAISETYTLANAWIEFRAMYKDVFGTDISTRELRADINKYNSNSLDDINKQNFYWNTVGRYRTANIGEKFIFGGRRPTVRSKAKKSQITSQPTTEADLLKRRGKMEGTSAEALKKRSELKRFTPRQQYRLLFKKGIKAFDDGYYNKAVKLYKQAYKSYPETKLNTRIALCYKWLGNNTKALEYYQKFVKLAEQGIKFDKEKKRNRELLKRVKERMIPQLSQ